jgi:cobalt-zinc-cadmium efflux system outer membrane protein
MKSSHFGYFFLVLFIGFNTVQVNAAGNDTLKVTLHEVDSIFVKNNLLLLAEGFNIEASQALEISAKMYPNPTFTADLNIYDPQNQRAFHVDNTGQKQFVLEQLILIGGKRKTDIDIARKNTELAKFNFEELLRSIQFQVNVSFFQLNQQYRVLKLYDEQLGLLDTLIHAYEVQANKGNVPVKDLVRLKSIYIKFNNNKSELMMEHLEEMKKMQIFIHSTSYIVPILDDKIYTGFSVLPVLDSVQNLAFKYRPDLKVSNGEVQLAALELKHERQMVVPDIKINFSYDQRGGAFINQFNGGFSIPLPLWAHNRGNINFAKTNLKLSDLYYDMKKEEIVLEVSEAYTSLLVTANEYFKCLQLYNNDFTNVYKGIAENFTKKNISIIEFTDFMESYNETMINLENVRANLAKAAKKINFVTASNQY